jgi:S-disulfanyl-L-cysteine oxidoreductase SoxD
MRILIGLILFLAPVVCAQESVSVWDGVFAGEQASRGKARFAQQCAGCHGAKLEGITGPQLAGSTFKGNWDGLTADDLFEYIKKSMPRGQPGSLSREQVAELVAFVLTSNGYPAGQKELPNDAGLLQKIRISATKPAN